MGHYSIAVLVRKMKQRHGVPCMRVHSLFTVIILILIGSVFAPNTEAKSSVSDDDLTPNGQLFKVQIFTNIIKPLKPQDFEREVNIYLPAAYISDRTNRRRFPVLYLLHGSPGRPDDFFEYGHWQIFLEQSAAKYGYTPPILVAPNGNYTEAAFGDSEWLNSADGANRFEDFIVDQVVPWIDQHYRTIASQQGRAIGGVSEGGYGAVNITLHNPDTFSNVLALSGYYNNDGSGWARRMMGHNRDFLANNSPLAYINSADAEAIHTKDWSSVHFFIGSGLDEKRYTTESTEMVAQLNAHNVDADLYQLDGKHSWTLWNSLFDAGLKNIYASGKSVAPGSSTESVQTTQ
jgi:S-formylglutathione hydrolase FrmB